MRVAIYTRLSFDRDGKSPATATQEKHCRRYAKDHGYEIAVVHTDNDSAFKRVDRPGFDAVISAVDSGAVDGVLAWKLDRLTRQPRDLERLLDVCEQRGAFVASVTEPVDSSTEMGLMMIRQLVGWGRMESANISLRARSANEALARQGKPRVSGQRPFGYTHRYEVDPVEAKLIRDAVRRVLAGEPVGSIARQWNAQGIRTTAGNEWRPAILRRVLMSPHIAGVRVYHGEEVGSGGWDAILDDVTHKRVRAALTDPRRDTGGGGPARYALSGGILRCGACGARMVSRPRADKVRRYVCSTEPGRSSCGKVGILAVPLEEMVRDLCAESVPALQPPAEEGDRAEVVRQIRDDERHLDKLVDDHHDGLLPRSSYLRQLRRLTDRVEASRARLTAIDARASVQVLPDTPAAFRAAWDAADNEWRRHAVTALLDHVEIAPARTGLNRFDPGRVTPRFRV